MLIKYYGYVMRAFIKVFLLVFCFVQVGFAGNEIVFSALSLDEATKKIIEESKSKVLGAKTEMFEGKEVHVIKTLTSDGRVQYLKVDVETGKLLK